MSGVPVHDQLRGELADWERAGLRRRLSPPRGRDFSSNDYLSLAHDPRVVQGAREALEQHGAGTPSARLLRGHLDVHAAVERAAAAWLRTESALLFPTGYQANLALLTTVARRGDVLFCERSNHASLIDAARLSRARVELFDAERLDDLAARLRLASGARRRLVCLESVESTSGRLAPLADVARVAAEHDAWLLVDEAHAAGLYGEHGAGLVAREHVGDRVLARVVTGGKALGVAGAFVAGPQLVIDTLLHLGRPFVFTTAPPPATAGALTAAIRIVAAERDRADRAHAAARRLRAALLVGGVEAAGESPIVPVPIGDPARAVDVAQALQREGFDVRALRPPTVPSGTSRLRIVCHEDHGDDEVDALAAAVLAALRAPAATTTPATSGTPASPHTDLRGVAVLGTDTGVGKTVVSALLLRAIERAEPGRARYLKPVQTGPDSDTETVGLLADLGAGAGGAPIVELPLPASVDQAARDAGVEVRVADVLAAARKRLSPDAVWVVEGAGGLLVPFGRGEDQSDLFARLGLPVVLVARSSLGTLNHTRLTVEALRRRGLRPCALFLVGRPHPANVATLGEWLPDVPLFELPRFGDLATARLDEWLDATDLGGVLP